MNKKILIISYHFPPSQAVGGLRAANFARFLPSSGWQPSVLTIKDKYVDNKDNERLQGLESIIIYKTNKLPKMMELYSLVKSSVKMIVKRTQNRADGSPASGTGEDEGETSESTLQRLKRYYASLFLALPDYEKNWILPAAIKAVREIRRNKIDCILTSCPPYSVHLVGLLAHMATGVKWIADFRDPWYVASKKRMYPTCPLSRKIESLLERQVMKRASLVLCNTERLRDTLESAYSKVKKNGFVYIPNGISTDIFSGLNNLPKYEKFTLTYTGSLYFFRTPEPIFKALKELVDEGQLDRDSFNIKLVGHCETIDGSPTIDLVSAYGLVGNVEIIPPVPYLKSLEIVKKSHLALLFAPDQPFQIPAKVYDYIGTGTRILALAGEGATADMVEKTSTGNVFQPGNHDDLKAFLFDSITKQVAVSETVTLEAMKKFDREKVVSDLAGYLNIQFEEVERVN
jgi:glycosyltransferase involved in cell wall biosynthesis